MTSSMGAVNVSWPSCEKYNMVKVLYYTCTALLI